MASRLTATKRKLFLKAYAECGTIREAAKAAGAAHSMHYEWMQDPDYAVAFAEAERDAINLLESELYQRIYQGTEEPVIYQGELCYKKDATGKLTNKPLTIRRKNDTLLIFALKGKKPEVYRDNWKGELALTGNVQVNHRLNLRTLSDEQLEQLESMFRLDSGDDSSES